MNVWKTLGTIGGSVFAQLFGGLIVNRSRVGPALATVAYSAAPVPNLALSNDQTVTPTDAVAFVMGAPLFGTAAMSSTNPPVAGLVWTLTIINTTGGALGAVTFNAVYKLGAAFTQPATGFQRSIQFRWNGTNHVEVGRTAADVAN